jgi:sporulation protein YlmC with PRC-barrel domain
MNKMLSAFTLALLLGAAAPAMAAQDAVPGQTAPQRQAATEMMATVPNNALTVSTYYNEDVYDNQENKIGDVNDILLDTDGRISAVIVGVGGFLGIGEKDVAVPFKALKVAEKSGDRYLVIETTKEALQAAPGYTYDRTKGIWVPATKQPS